MMATPLLAEFAGKTGRTAYVHRNALGSEMIALAEQLYQQRQSRAPNESFVIGYGSGTPTHEIDFKEATAALVSVLDRYRHVKLWIAGPLALPEELFAERVVRFPLTDWRGWFELLSQMDVALAPLELDNIFCRAKSEIKFVEAAALAVPVVASDIDPFRNSMNNGHDGFLAANDKEWEQALTLLIEQPERRLQIGENARRNVLQHYNAQARAKDLSAILPSLMNAAANK
jgi:glycosyltransferase involved in cell wall biosynthesis